MTETLLKRHCVPCEGGVPPLTREQAEELGKQTPEWSIHDDSKAIERTYAFKDFKEAVAFINKVADIAEEENHHPDINLHNYKKVTFTLSTHAIKGLSDNDFILAAKIDQAYSTNALP